jgi:sensor histidine kinase YesM
MIVVFHAAAWILFFSLPYLLRPQYVSTTPPANTERPSFDMLKLVNLFLWIGIFYFNAYVIVPHFIHRKKHRLFFLTHIGLLVAYIVITGLFFNLLIGPQYFSLRPHILFNLFAYLFIFACSTAYQLVRDRIKADKLANEKENENLKTELSLLRSQVSPHFMFNVLNNMVALARKQSDQLEPSLIKLSSLMRYMLYETDEEKVPLEKEIDYLQSYIDLQQQRFGKNVNVKVCLKTVDDHYEIEPMLLIPFVENAFKHGTGLIKDATIDIELKAEKNMLNFSVRNKYNEESREIKDKSSGIGLSNVKRRLNLLYGKNHGLLITRTDDWFVVSLQIYLH